MDAKQKEYYDSMGASGEMSTNTMIAIEQLWQRKRIADALEKIIERLNGWDYGSSLLVTQRK
jgi:hypothetical protein